MAQVPAVQPGLQAALLAASWAASATSLLTWPVGMIMLQMALLGARSSLGHQLEGLQVRRQVLLEIVAAMYAVQQP
jgi:hypothetical protein